MSSTKRLCLVEVTVWSKIPDLDENSFDLTIGDWMLDFTADSHMQAESDGIGWEQLWKHALPDLAKWIEARKPPGDSYIDFSFMTLWELWYHKGYNWEFGADEYESEAYCLGLVDTKLWTVEGLGLVDKVDYDKEETTQ